MKRRVSLTLAFAALAALIVPLAGLQQAAPPDDADVVRPKPRAGFDVVHVFLDVADAALAAYQVEVTVAAGDVTVVGVEGGEPAEFSEPPYYDEKAMQGERVVIGAFSTADADELPTGRVRVATIHVLIGDGDGEANVSFESDLQVVATVGGRSIDAEVSLVRGSES